MSSKAIAKDTGISVKKIKHIADLVRGMKVSEALINGVLNFAFSCVITTVGLDVQVGSKKTIISRNNLF